VFSKAHVKKSPKRGAKYDIMGHGAPKEEVKRRLRRQTRPRSPGEEVKRTGKPSAV